MKHLIAIGLAIALVAEFLLFVGIGFGTGALNTTAVTNGYTQTPALAGSSWGDGMSWQVGMDAGQSGSPITTAMLPGYQSTSEGFWLEGGSNGDCGNTGRPTWAPGVGADYGYFIVQYVVGGSSVPFTALLDGASVSSTAAGYGVAANSTSAGVLWYCGVETTQTISGVQSFDQFSPALGATHGTTYFHHTISLLGLYASGQLKVSFHLFYTYCDGVGAVSGNVCDLLLTTNTNPLPANGGQSLTASTSVNAYTAGASVQLTNPGPFYNGGTISVVVQTGYDGPNGYQMYVQCPAPRPCSGSADPAFSTYTVGNQLTGGTFSWKIPANYAINSSKVGWNTVSITLVANYGVAAQALNVQLGISPSYNPAAPVVRWAGSAGSLYPSVGDTVTLTIYANASAHSTPVSAVLLNVFYLMPGGSSASSPACGGAYVTTGCPGGQTLSVTPGNHTIATYQFLVNPPLGAVAIGGQVNSQSATSQGNTTSFFINIKPAGCTVGTSCDPSGNQVNLWYIVGPILFAAMLMTGAALIVFIPGIEALGPWRYAIIVIAIGAVAVLYVIGFQSWFAPGGPL